jgi:hypothetical protein
MPGAEMKTVDGNAIAGRLYDHFGADMTSAWGACGHCGARAQIAELEVYLRAPGPVARCRSCGGVVIVLVDIRQQTVVNMDGFRLDD